MPWDGDRLSDGQPDRGAGLEPPGRPCSALLLARRVASVLDDRNWTLATAESCTGGLIGAFITAVPGSSSFYLGGVVAYSSSAKERLLGVDPALLGRLGAVSRDVAAAMARGARALLGADLAVAVTGIAGPGGGTEDKPVGLVYVATATPDAETISRHLLPGDRHAVRAATLEVALRAIIAQGLVVRTHRR